MAPYHIKPMTSVDGTPDPNSIGARLSWKDRSRSVEEQSMVNLHQVPSSRHRLLVLPSICFHSNHLCSLQFHLTHSFSCRLLHKFHLAGMRTFHLRMIHLEIRLKILQFFGKVYCTQQYRYRIYFKYFCIHEYKIIIAK